MDYVGSYFNFAQGTYNMKGVLRKELELTASVEKTCFGNIGWEKMKLNYGSSLEATESKAGLVHRGCIQGDIKMELELFITKQMIHRNGLIPFGMVWAQDNAAAKLMSRLRFCTNSLNASTRMQSASNNIQSTQAVSQYFLRYLGFVPNGTGGGDCVAACMSGRLFGTGGGGGFLP